MEGVSGEKSRVNSPRRGLHLRAPAKVNLTLEVLGRREDGYHEVRSILQTLDLGDEVLIEPGPGIEVSYGSGESFGDDLAYRAAHLLLKVKSFPGGRISIRKAIPVASGLGGGSSDAAAVLEGLDRLWGLGLGRETLARLGAELGSDVPFFLFKGTALAQGRGERILPLPSPRNYFLTILVPPVATPPNKTAFLYSLLDASLYTSGEYTLRLQDKLYRGEEIGPGDLFNVFEKVAFTAFAGLERYREAMLEAGAKAVHLAGSGPGLFCWEKTEERARTIYERLRGKGLTAFLASTV